MQTTLSSAATSAPRHPVRQKHRIENAVSEYCIGCKSWVWHSQTKKCFLKKMYDYRRIEETKCDDCVGFARKGKLYVFASQSGGGSGQSESAGETESSTTSSEKTTTTTETTTTTKWAVGFFGGGVGWQTATAGDASSRCIFSTGYDQPADFNLIPRPLNLATALMCCDSCSQNDRKQHTFGDRQRDRAPVVYRMQIVGVEFQNT